jgi:hypothetical protein
MKKVCLVISRSRLPRGLRLRCHKASSASAPRRPTSPLFAPGNLSAQVDLAPAFFSGLDIYGRRRVRSRQLQSRRIDSPDLWRGGPRQLLQAGTIFYFATAITTIFKAISALGSRHRASQLEGRFPDIKWLAKIESYIGLGLGAYIYNDSYDTYYLTGSISASRPRGQQLVLSPNSRSTSRKAITVTAETWGALGILFKL